MLPEIIIFEKESFLHIINKESHNVYFVSDDLKLYKISYEDLNKLTNHTVDKRAIEQYYKIRYSNLNEYLRSDTFVKRFYEKFKNELLVAGFTGGKDSVVLVEALKELNLNFIPIYIHIPYLETVIYNLNKKILKKCEVMILNVPKEFVIKTLKEGKPPFIKCQFRNIKNKLLREYAQRLGVKRKSIITGERIFESPARYNRLINKEYKNPIQGLTNGETFLFAAKINSLSKVYKYNTRVSCIPCARSSTTTFYLGMLLLKKFDKTGYNLLKDAIIKNYINRKIQAIDLKAYVYLGLYRFPEEKSIQILKTLSELKNYSIKINCIKVFKLLRKQYKYYYYLAKSLT